MFISLTEIIPVVLGMTWQTIANWIVYKIILMIIYGVCYASDISV